jgi:hypothetical protein
VYLQQDNCGGDLDEWCGWPAEGGRRVLLLHELRGPRVTAVSQNGCLVWVCSENCVLVAGLIGVLGITIVRAPGLTSSAAPPPPFTGVRPRGLTIEGIMSHLRL